MYLMETRNRLVYGPQYAILEAQHKNDIRKIKKLKAWCSYRMHSMVKAQPQGHPGISLNRLPFLLHSLLQNCSVSRTWKHILWKGNEEVVTSNENTHPNSHPPIDFVSNTFCNPTWFILVSLFLHL